MFSLREIHLNHKLQRGCEETSVESFFMCIMNNEVLKGSSCQFIERSFKRSPYTSELTKAIETTPQSRSRSK